MARTWGAVTGPRFVVSPTANDAARDAAKTITAHLASAIDVRGRASVALSGGKTPATMLTILAEQPDAWTAVDVFQVDERAVPFGDPARNWSQLQPLAALIPPSRRHPMPVEISDADVAYARELGDAIGRPPILDVVHLGLGDDGHTASLVPGDSAVDLDDQDVAWVGVYRGHPRLTLTASMIARARLQVWLVTGADKAEAVRDLTAVDASTPASLVIAGAEDAVVYLDLEAAQLLP